MPTDGEFMADILTANITGAQSVTDRIIINANEDALFWAKAYRELFDRVNNAANVSTTRQLERVLDDAAIRRESADRSIGHFEREIALWKESND